MHPGRRTHPVTPPGDPRAQTETGQRETPTDAGTRRRACRAFREPEGAPGESDGDVPLPA